MKVDIKKIEKLYNEKISPESIIQADFAKVIYRLSEKIGRIIGVIISREGGVEEVFVGDKNILYIPNLGRYRMFKGRLRRIRLIATILKDNFELTLFSELSKVLGRTENAIRAKCFDLNLFNKIIVILKRYGLKTLYLI